jgi:hypothetical protein
MTVPLLVPARVVASSLEALQEAGRANRECVVLWLASRSPTSIDVVDAYRPKQTAAADFFHLPQESMAAVFDVLRQRGLMIAAQVHTHPGQAFHSAADDQWAIIRHVGALSLVLPDFAKRTTAASFLHDIAVFRLSAENEWGRISAEDASAYIRGVA